MLKPIPPDLKKRFEDHRLWLASHREHGQQAVLKGFDLSDLNLQGVRLKGANLLGAEMTEVQLHAADLTGANLVGCCLATPIWSAFCSCNKLHFLKIFLLSRCNLIKKISKSAKGEKDNQAENCPPVSVLLLFRDHLIAVF